MKVNRISNTVASESQVFESSVNNRISPSQFAHLVYFLEQVGDELTCMRLYDPYVGFCVLQMYVPDGICKHVIGFGETSLAVERCLR